MLRNNLQDIPMLDDLALFIESKNVYAGVVMIAGPRLVAVQNDQIVFSYRALEFHLLARIFCCHTLKIFDEGLLAISYLRIVLHVAVTNE